MNEVPLRRNRDFLLLQSGQLLSTLGSNSSSIAYPLLVLGLTHSPVKAGIVTFARALPYPLFSLLAGVAADRSNRKRLMIAGDVLGTASIGTLAALLLTDAIAYWQIPIVAFVDGVGSVIFLSAQSGALRAVVSRRQLPAATATDVGRISVVRLAAPPLGGALFGVARALPFVVDAASYFFSTVSLLFMRTPFQEKREVDRSSVRAQMAEGVRYLWSQPFLRTCALLFGLGNFIFPGVLLVIVVAGKRQGLSGGEIGALTASFGAVLLVGSLVSGVFRRVFSVRQILLLELWTWTGGVFFLIWPNVFVLTAAILPQALTIPSTDSVVHGYRIAMTPDRLLGRVEGAARNISLVVTPVGPLVAGVLISAVSLRGAVAVFAAAGVVLAVWGTLSPSIRKAPSLDELEEQPPRPEPDANVAITA